jgi:hypothetical protein
MMKVIKKKEKIFKKIELRIRIDELETFGPVKGLPRRGNSTGDGYPYPSPLFLFNLVIKSLINVFNKFIFYFYTRRPFLLFTISIPYVFIISLNKLSLKKFSESFGKNSKFLKPLGGLYKKPYFY